MVDARSVEQPEENKTFGTCAGLWPRCWKGAAVLIATSSVRRLQVYLHTATATVALAQHCPEAVLVGLGT